MKFAPLAVLAAAAVLAAPVAAFADEATQVAAASTLRAGKMIYSANGQRIAQIYRVTPQGNPQVIWNSKLVTIPASTISEVEGKVTTTLTRTDLNRAN